MKNISFLVTLLFASSVFASSALEDCERRLGVDIGGDVERVRLIGGSECAISDLIFDTSIDMAKLQKFLDLEKNVGNNVTRADHINDLKVYGTSFGHLFLKHHVSLERLEDLVSFSVEELKVYKGEKIFDRFFDQIDLYRNILHVTPSELKEWLSYRFLNGYDLITDEDEYYDNKEVAKALPLIVERERLVEGAIDSIVNIIFTRNDERVIAIYPYIQDSGNEANIQWALVGRYQIVLLNKHMSL